MNPIIYKVWIHVERCDEASGTYEDIDSDLPHVAAVLHSEEEAVAFAAELAEQAHDLDLSQCDACGEYVTEITGCPNGKELCMDCMDSGAEDAEDEDAQETVIWNTNPAMP